MLFNQCSNLWQPFIWGAFYWNKAHILCQNWNHACWTRYFGRSGGKNVRNTLRTLPWLGSILVYNGFTWFSCGGKFTVRIMVIWFVWIDLKYCSIVWSMARKYSLVFHNELRVTLKTKSNTHDVTPAGLHWTLWAIFIENNETVTVLYSHVKTKNPLNTNGKIGHWSGPNKENVIPKINIVINSVDRIFWMNHDGRKKNYF